MIIEKIINNNVVITLNDKQHEIVVMGKGIGFQKKSGQILDQSKIEKRFVLDNKADAGRFEALVSSIPSEYFEVCSQIIDYALQVLPGRMSNSIYISLTDHINFTFERLEMGLSLENPLIQEVRSFYPTEYVVGEYAVALIQKELGVALPEDEAASIALHFVNAQFTTAMNDTMSITQLVRQIIRVVEGELHTQFDEKDVHYCRFVAHLKFLLHRVLHRQKWEDNESNLVEMISTIYKNEFKIAEKIAVFIKDKIDYEITEEEKAYLAIHTRRIQKNIGEED